MFELDECRNFWDGAEHVFGRLFKRYTPNKEHPVTYFWIKHEKKNKQFYRITNNLFIEK